MKPGRRIAVKTGNGCEKEKLMSECVYVSAVVTAREGCGAALERELRRVVPLVRAEAGCIRYDLHRSNGGDAFLFYEIWESDAALAAHGGTAHMAGMRAATAELVAGPAAVATWRALDVA
jgi:quinol monooxygenase YgiN